MKMEVWLEVVSIRMTVFVQSKYFTTGRGVITTNSKKIYDSLIKLRNHGIEKNFKLWKNKLGFSKNKKISGIMKRRN